MTLAIPFWQIEKVGTDGVRNKKKKEKKQAEELSKPTIGQMQNDAPHEQQYQA